MRNMNPLRPGYADMSLNCSIIGGHDDLEPFRRQAIIWTSDGLFKFGPVKTNLNAFRAKTQQFLSIWNEFKNVVCDNIGPSLPA